MTKLSKLTNNKGFTLVELLIVIAIIAILAAVALPVYSAQLENAREAVDSGVIRSAASLAQADYLLNDTTSSAVNYFIQVTENGDTNNVAVISATDGGTAHSWTPQSIEYKAHVAHATFAITINNGGEVTQAGIDAGLAPLT